MGQAVFRESQIVGNLQVKTCCLMRELTTVETQTVDQFSQLSEPSPQVVNRCITDLAVFDFVTEGPEVEREIRRSLGREGQTLFCVASTCECRKAILCSNLQASYACKLHHQLEVYVTHLTPSFWIPMSSIYGYVIPLMDKELYNLLCIEPCR